MAKDNRALAQSQIVREAAVLSRLTESRAPSSGKIVRHFVMPGAGADAPAVVRSRSGGYASARGAPARCTVFVAVNVPLRVPRSPLRHSRVAVDALPVGHPVEIYRATTLGPRVRPARRCRSMQKLAVLDRGGA